MTQKRPEGKDSLYLRPVHVVFTKGRESAKPVVPPVVEPGILPVDCRAGFAVTSAFSVTIPGGKMPSSTAARMAAATAANRR